MDEFTLNGTLDCPACRQPIVKGEGAPIMRPSIFRCPPCKVHSLLAEGEDALRLPTRKEFTEICEVLEDEESFEPSYTLSAIESDEAQRN